MSRRSRRSLVSLFSGALGLDLGLELVGFEPRVAVESNRHAAETIRLNRPNLPVIERLLEDVPTAELTERAGLNGESPFVVTGGPSCQPFSTAGRRGSIDDPRGTMFREFIRVVQETRPAYFVMENVTGVMSAAIRHRPLNERGPGFPPLDPEEELGSAFVLVLRELAELDYYVVFDVLNAADYGVAQKRRRLIFIGSRDGKPVRMPDPTHSEKGANGLQPWSTLKDAVSDLAGLEHHTYVELSAAKKRFLSMVPEGGNWRDLPVEVQAEAMGGAFDSWGGRSGFFRRLSWDAPSPALTTRPDSKATMFGHPRELRPLSVEEYTALQQFNEASEEWQFAGNVSQQYTQAGNAVPLGLGRAIGERIKRAHHGRPDPNKEGLVVSANRGLIERLAERPSTILNPDRMRRVKGSDAARAWLGEASRGRSGILDYVDFLE